MFRFRLYLALLMTVAMTATTLITGAAVAGAAERVLTDHAFGAVGWSTKLSGGDVPAKSGRTGLATIACTRFANLTETNNTAAVNLPTDGSLLHVGATETVVRTTTRKGVTTSQSRNDVASVLIGDASADGLLLEQVLTRTRTWHDAKGYHRLARVTVGSVTQYVEGVAVSRTDIPSGQDLNGEVLEVPGLAKITFGIKSGRVNSSAAIARALGLKIELLTSDTVARVGFAYSRIDGGATGGVMRGASWGSTVDGLGNIANSGRTALRPLPCVGTRGRVLQNEIAEVVIPDVARLGSVVSQVRGDQGNNTAYARGKSTIKRAGFGGRGLVLKGIQGEALVRRKSDGSYVRNAKGTQLGSITLNGESQPIPAPGETLTIPDVARITVRHVSKTTNGIRVTAVRVQLLQGSEIESTVKLGNVSLTVRRG